MLLLREESLKNLSCRKLSLAIHRLRIWGLSILRLNILRLAVLGLTLLRLALDMLRLAELLESLERVYTWEGGLSRGDSTCGSIAGVLTKDWKGGLEGVHDEVCLRLDMRVLTDLSHSGTIVRSLGWGLEGQMLLVS